MIPSGPLNRRALSFSSKRWGNWDSERVSVTPRLHRKWQAGDVYWGLASSLGSFLPPSEMSWGPGSDNRALSGCPAHVSNRWFPLRPAFSKRGPGIR